jgi:hypothetical protein
MDRLALEREARRAGYGSAKEWLARQEEAIELVRRDCDRLRGRLFEILEAVGLPNRQCDAAKRVIRRLTYDMQASLEATLRDARDTSNLS